MTRRTPGIHAMTPDNFVEVSPELAAERGITTGTHVRLRSPYGEVRIQALVTDRVHGRQLYMSLNSVDEPVNALTGSHTDRATHTPAFKESAVYMEILPDQEAEHQAQARKGKKDRAPLGPGNFRFGTRTPQSGVEIERKWARSDYSLPGTRSDDKLIQIKTSKV